MESIAAIYAESLFDLAKEENMIESYCNDMKKIHEVFNDESFVKFFSHVTLKDEIKINVLKESFQNQVSTYVFNFLLLLIKKRRIKYIVGICKEFQALCNNHFGIKEGILYTAYELNQNEIADIEKAMSIKVNSKVQLRVVVDPSLIGGIKVEIENHVYDNSLSYKLESLKKELLRK